jgi:pantetheine-phosphate adenylyltransferase
VPKKLKQLPVKPSLKSNIRWDWLSDYSFHYNTAMTKTFAHAALGGTFDRLHIGHQHLIDFAAKKAEKLTIGLTTNAFVRHKELSQLIQSYRDRRLAISSFLKKINAHKKSRIIALKSVFGSTLFDHTIDALIVTQQTRPGADLINNKRQQLDLPVLPIVSCNLIRDDLGDYISSTKIRRGLINRQGQAYIKLFDHDLVLSPDQKKALKIPQGTLITKPTGIIDWFRRPFVKVATVGDHITQFALDHHLPMNYAVVDHHTNRLPVDLDWQWWRPGQYIKAQNPPGHITSRAAQAVAQACTYPTATIEIDGEEDLIGFPAVLLLPLNSLVAYGQPGKGVVMMQVSETVKNKSARFLNPNF